MDDDWESAHGLDNTTDDSFMDPDNDELTNVEEFKNGTDPYDPDTDGDGMHDGWEVYYAPYLDPLNASDADDDPDRDGYTNLQEYQNCTDPLWEREPPGTIYKKENNILGISNILWISLAIFVFSIITIVVIKKLRKERPL